jgi:hypothetical protein
MDNIRIQEFMWGHSKIACLYIFVWMGGYQRTCSVHRNYSAVYLHFARLLLLQ